MVELPYSQKYWRSLNSAVWLASRALDGVKSATTCIMSLHIAYEIILADF